MLSNITLITIDRKHVNSKMGKKNVIYYKG